jgi:hypothetical protein
LSTDPLEMVNRIGDPAAAANRQELENELVRLLMESGAK